MNDHRKNPFIVGDWIKNDTDFIGRQHLLKKYLPLEKQFNWLIGARRMGKTSLLRYLQRQYRKQNRMIPLFWDVSGANSSYDLKLSFIDSLEAAGIEMQAVDIHYDIDQMEGESLFNNLRWLMRQCRKNVVRIVLLIDESEALFRVAVQDEQFLHRFKALLLNQLLLSVILASNHGLASYDKLSTTHFLAPFLQSFSPPDYITPWGEDEAKILIQRCTNDSSEEEKIIEFTGCLPFLVQMMCFYYFDRGDLNASIEAIRENNVLDLFFRDDFQYLDRMDYQILAELIHLEPAISQAIAAAMNTAERHIRKRLNTLTLLGFTKHQAHDKFGLNNSFLRSWIKENISQQSAIAQPKQNPGESSETLHICFEENSLKFSVSGNSVVNEIHQTDNPLIPDRFKISNFYDLHSLKQIGQQLFTDLFPTHETRELFRKFYSSENGGNLVFSTGAEKTILLPFEILHDGHSFISLRKGLYRSMCNGDKNTATKFPSENPVNILLIASDTPPDIPFVDNEIILLKKQFHRIAREHGLTLNTTTLLSHESDFATVTHILRSNHFHIIHFAGHSSTDPVAATTHVYLWENSGKSGRVRAVTGDVFFSEMPSTPLFFYLNGCSSAGLSNGEGLNFCGFAPKFLKAGGQAFLGNITITDDRASAEFSMDFYWNLFSAQFSYSAALKQTRSKWAAQARFQENGHLLWLLPALWQNY